MAGTIIDMSKIKQLRHLKKAGVSNRQIAKGLRMSRDKANEYVNRAESDPLGIEGLLKLDDPVLEKRLHPGNPAYTDERLGTVSKSVSGLKVRQLLRFCKYVNISVKAGQAALTFSIREECLVAINPRKLPAVTVLVHRRLPHERQHGLVAGHGPAHPCHAAEVLLQALYPVRRVYH